MMQRVRLIQLILCVLLGTTACSYNAQVGRYPLGQLPLEKVQSEYRLQSGDRLRVLYMLKMQKTPPDVYKLEYGDEVRVMTQDREDLSGNSHIAPDGTANFPYLEPLKVVGLSISEVRTALMEKYSSMITAPKITVILMKSNSRANSFLDSLSRSNLLGPAIFESIVGLDGMANFPQFGFIPVAGATINDVNITLSNKYADILSDIDVTLQLVSQGSSMVTVLGEVKRPGAFPAPGSMTLSTALGLAEGWLSSAEIEDLIVVQHINNETVVNKYDLKKDILLATRIQLTGGDMVYVPHTKIKDINIFIDEFIRRNIPISVGAGTSF